ncbi:MAG TPA: hypothetical protein VFB84_05445 [Micromonosporaceae bacterium]|nr:hypothetical protein [Micromonosporaceae bacterium]
MPADPAAGAGALRTRVDSWQLRRHVVRVDRPDAGGVLGTGFFVAPGWVLTAAHVAHDGGVELDRVAVVPADPAVGEDPVRAEVVTRSAPPDGTALWPFPDLALCRSPTNGWVTSRSSRARASRPRPCTGRA